MLRSIASEELTEWAAYYHLNPFGTYRSDLSAAIIASSFVNTQIPKGKKRVTPADYMPRFSKEPARALDADDMIAKLQGMTGG